MNINIVFSSLIDLIILQTLYVNRYGDSINLIGGQIYNIFLIWARKIAEIVKIVRIWGVKCRW